MLNSCVSLHLGYAIPAVNCVTSSSVNTCLEAARKNDAPIIIQFSSGGSQVRKIRCTATFVKEIQAHHLRALLVLRWSGT